jgi:hypothetical protein
MTMRSRREAITFLHPFRIKGIDRLLPPGAYQVITDEELIEGLSFPAFRRVATVSGTFVSGPHDSEADCLRKIAEINSAPAKSGRAAPAE